jgi:hypothetical protein
MSALNAYDVFGWMKSYVTAWTMDSVKLAGGPTEFSVVPQFTASNGVIYQSNAVIGSAYDNSHNHDYLMYSQSVDFKGTVSSIAANTTFIQWVTFQGIYVGLNLYPSLNSASAKYLDDP